MADPASLRAALRLLAITDDLRDGVEGLAARAEAAARGGATMVQLRLKVTDARTLVLAGRALHAVLRPLGVPLLVNDRVDVALACGAAGAHLGADDLPVRAARRIVPPDFVLGASLGSDAELENAREADYVGIGPLYATGSKLDAGDAIGVAEFARLARAAGRPAVAIGGITPENVGPVMAAGADGIAVIRAVFSAADPTRAAAALRSASGT
ncbi:MAG TPA: thiamine phosphate synthase [Gemmatimonadaceae bacterium]|nr:thiamine phosphate synthase [Gemmatimonadaceae bacterium]